MRLRVLRGLSVAFPAVFLSIAAFMTSAVLTRLIRLQREQIAQLKAFGYSSAQVGWHYLKFALVIVTSADGVGADRGHVARGRRGERLSPDSSGFPTLTLSSRLADDRASPSPSAPARRSSASSARCGRPCDCRRPRRCGRSRRRNSGRPIFERSASNEAREPDVSHGAAQSRAQAVAGVLHRARPRAGDGHSRSSRARCATASTTCWISNGTCRSGRT